MSKNGEWKKGIYNHLGILIPIQTSFIPNEKNCIYYSMIDKFWK